MDAKICYTFILKSMKTSNSRNHFQRHKIDNVIKLDFRVFDKSC